MSRSMVFLDRDGVINRRPGTSFVTRPEELEILPKVADAIRLLNEARFPVVVVTNQRGISLGLYDTAGLHAIHLRLCQYLAGRGARIDAIYYCPHGVADGCNCRKPGLGLFLQAARDFPSVDMAASYVIGDSARDLLPAAALGCRKILIDGTDGSASRELAAQNIVPDWRGDSLFDAVTQYLLPTSTALAMHSSANR